MIREALEKLSLKEATPKIEILKLATAKNKNSSSTDELRKLVSEYFGIKLMPPKILTSNVQTFVKEYNKLLKDSKYNKQMLEIFNFREDVGRGELLLACLSNSISIGGTSQSYDVDFGKNKIEVKEVNFKTEFMNNFRLGKESKAPMQEALNEIKYLFEIAKWFYPDLNTSEFKNKIEEGQELTKLIKFLKEVDIKKLDGQEKVDVFINKKGKIYFNEQEIGTLNDFDIVEKLKSLTSNSKKLKSFKQIERELVRKISDKNIQYYFFEAKVGTLFHKKDLSGSTIDTITQGGIKFRVPYTN